jgi:hypothetical protein
MAGKDIAVKKYVVRRSASNCKHLSVRAKLRRDDF